jgi:UDP-N-acetylmuramyl pentapeptide phosphotransferase/UDP-N-acetylglucosamine-1-phosphate transferase
MDISTVMQNLNWYAVVAAALSTFIIGGIWYGLFQKSWMDANHFTPEHLKDRKMPLVFGLSFVLSFVMALNLAMFIGNQGLAYGFMAGFLAGFGWVALAIAIIALFEKRPLKYVLINGGYMLVAFSVMGAILGAWK